MSSGISIEGRSVEGRLKPAPAGDSVGAGFSRPEQSFRPWHFFVLGSILLATVAVILTRRTAAEHLILLSICMAAAGVVAATLYATLAPLVRPGEEPFDRLRAGPVTVAGRDALEREKLLTLRAIKDLEFDRAMGKLSEKDFDEMSARLRQRALTLMQALDAGAAYEPQIQREIESRLANLDHGSVATSAPRVCGCGTTNDADAAFCKRCGTRLEATA
jgi:hypothetical protein